MTKIDRNRRISLDIPSQELVQVNGVTYLEVDLKLNQLRVLLVIVSSLQRALRLRLIRGRNRPGVPELFLPPPVPGSSSDPVRQLSVPLRAFHMGPHNSARVRETLSELSSMPVCFPASPFYRPSAYSQTASGPVSRRTNADRLCAPLIAGFESPAYARTVAIRIRESVVTRLLLVEEGYTSYSLDTALSLTSRYSIRIYWLLCAWRRRGGLVISLEEFRRMLALSRAYDRKDNIATHILRPAAQELASRGSIWFSYRFAVRKDRDYLCLKIKYTLSEQERQLRISQARSLCSRILGPFDFSAGAWSDLLTLIERTDPEDLENLTRKITDLATAVKHRRDIHAPEAYIRAALRRWQTDWHHRYTDHPDG